jgi:tRNA (guanine10-N2)-methyltransferase
MRMQREGSLRVPLYEVAVTDERTVQVGQGSARRLMHAYALTDRHHIGTTSMDPKLSLICANMAWARPNALMYDMFAGTCSLLIACAHFGAYTLGTEIDGRVLRGAGNAPDAITMDSV